MTATDVARATKPHLWTGRGTRWGAQAWTEHLDLVTEVLEAAGTQAAASTRQEVLAEAAALLDAAGHHDAAEHLRDEAGLAPPPQPARTSTHPRALRAVDDEEP